MEIVLVIAAGVAVYWFFKRNTGRGVRAVRAYVFLRALELGMGVDEANAAANGDILNGPTDIIKDAMTFLRVRYGGKQLPMIADAYERGFVLLR